MVVPSAGWTDLSGVTPTGIPVRQSSTNKSSLQFFISATKEPQRLQGEFRRRHNCVYMGANLDDLGRWRDGPCQWIRSTVDCLCKRKPLRSAMKSIRTRNLLPESKKEEKCQEGYFRPPASDNTEPCKRVFSLKYFPDRY